MNFFYEAPEQIEPRPISFDACALLLRRFRKFVSLDAADIAAVEHLLRNRRRMQAHEMLVREDSKPDRVYLMTGGIGFRYRFLPDGRRQIFGYLLPGELCDTAFVISNACDHNVGLLCDAEVAVINPAELMTTMVNHPRIERGLLMMALGDAAIMREWLLNLGQRDALHKMAHFFCEMITRLEAAGAVEADGSYALPITQNELADTLGLTVVHVNRTLQRLRHDSVLEWSRRRFKVLDWALLAAVGGFNSNYLALEERPVEPRLNAYGC
ncbi:Crp/Fnr family transcriptional regulator [Sphingomonas sabuli]|uniref:Crp/Fnr family transcriptional regulator n=1 Tax=Sphingomonas sabuli TaxID=2764186 RepID=A0A7G9KZC8_9SPHN|nr:Crp/Fnr family transcriptional regulator [Sphingomonas sabuli]QNM81727.1 Crp/Fnr family transcriptional regulator [Sphingomonas sabuli]